MTQFDVVHSPPHYAHGGPLHTECGKTIECIDIVEDMGFNRGNAMKYLWRAGKKDPVKTQEDLEKALWYIQREITSLESDH